jgi:cell division protein FtsQ
MSEAGRFTSWARRPWVWVLAGIGVLALIATCLRFAPWFAVDDVEVSGNSQVATDEVVAAASISDGTPLLTVPLDEIEQRVEALDAVAEARATRDWPSSIRIVVRERRPIGYVSLVDGVGLVGSDGSVYREQSAEPDDLPHLPDTTVGEVEDSYRSQLDDSGVAAFEVARDLPRSLQKSVATIDADSARSVVVTFDDGVVVKWGSSGSSETKSDVVTLLRKRQGWGSQFTVVDVTAPQAPATMHASG